MVSFNEDQYIKDRFESETRWIVTLSDGRKVFQDEDRPNYLPSAWLRLKEFLSTQDLKIEGITLQFRSHIENLPEKKSGYYFSKAAGADWGIDKTIHYYVVGWLDGDLVRRTWWRIPELIAEKQDEKTVDELKKTGLDICLIRN